jgi:hypothetical protein
MTNLRQLLATWENWSARNALTRALGTVATNESCESPAAEPALGALDALRDSAELVELLTSWQWQAMYAARREGATWEQVGAAARTGGDAARAAFAAVLIRQERFLGRDVRAFREVL